MRLSLSTLRRLFAPLEITPLHPQWLVLGHRRWLPRWVSAHACGTVLDVGCGNGSLRGHLAATTRYVGIDFPVTSGLGYRGRVDVFADGAALPIASGCADTVILLDVLEHMRRPEEALNEAARVLRPGGKCLVHVPFLYPLHDIPHDYQRWTRYGLERLFSARNFQSLEITETLGSIESAAALLSISIAAGLWRAIECRSLRAVPGVIAASLIPLINLFGWLSGRLLKERRMMPFGYCVVAVKRGEGELSGGRGSGAGAGEPPLGEALSPSPGASRTQGAADAAD